MWIVAGFKESFFGFWIWLLFWNLPHSGFYELLLLWNFFYFLGICWEVDGLSYLMFKDEELPIGGGAVVSGLFEFLSPDPNWLMLGTTFVY